MPAPTRRGVRVLWWVLVVLFAGGIVASALAKPQHTADDLIAITFGAWGLVGALVAWRRPGNALGWMFLAIGALSGVAGVAGVLTSQPGATVRPAAWYVVLAAWYQQWFWFPTFAMSTVLTVLLFPDGLPSRRWRPVLWTTVGSIAVLTTLAAFDPTLSSAATTGHPAPPPLPNPLASPGLPVLGQGMSSPPESSTARPTTAAGSASRSTPCSTWRSRSSRCPAASRSCATTSTTSTAW